MVHTVQNEYMYEASEYDIVNVKQAGNIDMTKAEKFGGLNHFYELKYDISNGAVLDMPKTGDNGFWKFGILGFGLMAAVFAVMTKRKKKS